MNLQFKKLNEYAVTPSYAHSGDACFDLSIATVQVLHQESVPAAIIGTGLAFDIPAGYVLKVYSRSGHGFKYGLRLANTTGIIDSGYKGEVMLKLVADTVEGAHLLSELNVGDRIAQAMLEVVPEVTLIEVNELGNSERGTRGLGSSGM